MLRLFFFILSSFFLILNLLHVFTISSVFHGHHRHRSALSTDIYSLMSFSRYSRRRIVALGPFAIVECESKRRTHTHTQIPNIGPPFRSIPSVNFNTRMHFISDPADGMLRIFFLYYYVFVVASIFQFHSGQNRPLVSLRDSHESSS